MDRSRKILRGHSLHVPLPEVSLGETLYNKILQYRERTAFIDEFTGESITYNELFLLSHRLADAFKTLDVEIDNTIVICSENNIYFFCPLVAALCKGIITAPISNSYLEDELLHALFLTQPKIVFCSRKNYQQYLQLKQRLPFIEHVVIMDLNEPADGVESLQTFIDKYSSNRADKKKFEIPDFDIDAQVAFIMFTSGTTGLPKGAMITHKNVITSIIHLYDPNVGFYKLYEPFLCFMPFFHVSGLVSGLGLFFWGMCGNVFSKFDENAFLSALEKYRISHLCVVSSLIVLLAKSPLVNKYDLSCIKEISCCSGPICETTEEEIRKRLHIKYIRHMYGMTETTFIATSVSVFEEKIGSVGKVLPTMSIIIRDPDTGETLGPNQTGEICFKGNLIMKGYYGNLKATREMFTEDGWMRTGDLGYFDEHEYLFIVDRLKELIKYNGFQVPPAEIEALLLRHPKIKECGVIGVPDEQSGELPMAFVVKQKDVQMTEQEVIDYVAANVSREKELKGGVRFIDEIPQNASGKMLRRVLRLMIHDVARL